MVKTGLKVWPFISLSTFAFVPVEKRIVVFSLAGLCWGVYLSLIVAN